MYAATSYFNSAIAAGSRQLNIKANIGADTYLNDSIVSLYFEDTICPDEFFEVGTASAAYIEITLLNVTGNFDGLIVTPQIGVYTSQGSFEYVPLGVFIVEETVKNRGSLTLKCFDKTVMLEQPYSTSISWPNTITNVMNDICSKVGVTFTGTLPAYTVSFPNGAATYREVVSRIAGICGGFAKFDRNGNLTIKNYVVTPSIQQTITADNYFDLNKEDRAYAIGEVTIKDDSSNISYSNGSVSSTTMELVIDSNPWATAAIGTDVYNKLNGLSFLPCNMSWQGNPALDVGDWITINEYNATPFNTILTGIKYTFAGGLSSEIEAVGEGKTKNQYNTNPTNIPNPSDTVQTNVDYNGVTIDNDNGIQVTSLLNLLKMNATDGLKMTRLSDGIVVFNIDSSGNISLIGTISSGSTITGSTFSGGSINIGSGNFQVDSTGKLTTSSQIIANGGVYSAQDFLLSGTTPTLVASNGTLAIRSTNNNLYLQAGGGGRVNVTLPSAPSTYVDLAAQNITAYGNLIAQGTVSFSTPTWTNALLLNGFTTNNSRSVRFTKVGATVYVEGEVAYKVGVVFNLPAAYRPSGYALSITTPQTTGTGAYNNIISVGTNGDVSVLASQSSSFGVALNFSFIAEQ